MTIITARMIGSTWEGALSDCSCHVVGTSRLTIRISCCSICFFGVIQSLLLRRVRRSIWPISKMSLWWLSVSDGPCSGRSIFVPMSMIYRIANWNHAFMIFMKSFDVWPIFKKETEINNWQNEWKSALSSKNYHDSFRSGVFTLAAGNSPSRRRKASLRRYLILPWIRTICTTLWWNFNRPFKKFLVKTASNKPGSFQCHIPISFRVCVFRISSYICF